MVLGARQRPPVSVFKTWLLIERQCEAYSIVGQQPPKPHTASLPDETIVEMPPPPTLPKQFDVQEHVPNNDRSLDVDGMNVLIRLEASSTRDPNSGLRTDLELAAARRGDDDAGDLPWGNEPATATWAPMMAEVHPIAHANPSPLTQLVEDLRT
jgi:hypothetical protein